jgi:hypothetical protein
MERSPFVTPDDNASAIVFVTDKITASHAVGFQEI